MFSEMTEYSPEQEIAGRNITFGCMKTHTETRKAFHDLIDTIEDEETLNGYLALVRQLADRRTGRLWDSLTPSEQRELMLAYEESLIPSNLMSHQEVKEQHQKWLRP